MIMKLDEEYFRQEQQKNPILYRDRIFYTFCYSDRKSGNRVQPEKTACR